MAAPGSGTPSTAAPGSINSTALENGNLERSLVSVTKPLPVACIFSYSVILKEAKANGKRKVRIARIGKSDIFPLIIISLLHCSTPPPGPFTSTVSATHTLHQLLPLYFHNAGLIVLDGKEKRGQLRDQD